MDNVEKGLFAYLEAQGKKNVYGTSVLLDNDGTGVKIASRWNNATGEVEKFWDTTVLGPLKSESELAEIGQKVESINASLSKPDIFLNGESIAPQFDLALAALTDNWPSLTAEQRQEAIRTMLVFLARIVR